MLIPADEVPWVWRHCDSVRIEKTSGSPCFAEREIVLDELKFPSCFSVPGKGGDATPACRDTVRFGVISQLRPACSSATLSMSVDSTFSPSKISSCIVCVKKVLNYSSLSS